MMRYPLVIGSAILLSLAGTVAGQQADKTQPVSIGIVLDTSGSMGANIALARGLVSELANSAGSQDDFALIQASDRPVVLSGFVGAGDAQAHASFTQAKGRSALLDAIYLGSQLMRASRNARKVLLVISDGVDNSSRYTAAEIRDSIREAGVRVYAIGVGRQPIAGGTTTEEALHSTLLPQLAEQARGAYFSVERTSELPALAQQLNAAVRTQP
jgi:Ca-activated chloride channel homolog